jgi:type VI protein secretion system component VasK
MTFDDAVSEQTIKVEFDPRLQLSQEAITQKYDAIKELESHLEKMTNIVKQLVESKNTATAIKDQLTKEDVSLSSAEKKYEAEIKSSTEIIKKLDDLIAIYLGKVDERQGITRNPETTVSQRFGQASSYVRSRFGNQTDTEKQLINQFKDAFKEAISKTNAFFTDDWKTYKTLTESIQISSFKETKLFD